jgi:hypothetical protein
MATVLDWSRFETGPVGPDKAFEAFTAQLFERWLRREVGPVLSTYVLHGAGGDGGVEAYATLPSGDIVGLQAKWFPQNLDDSRMKQIRGSLDAAMKSCPGLRQYIVAMPRNLTRGTSGKGGRIRRGGIERWDKFIADVAKAHPTLEVIRWDEAGLLEQLACAGNQEIRALWFDGELTFQAIETAWKKTESRLAARYLPHLHAVGQIDATLAEDLWSKAHVQQARTQLVEIQSQLAIAVSDLEGFTQLTASRRPHELDATIPVASTAILSLQQHAGLLDEILSAGPRRQIADCPPTDALSELSAHLEIFKKTNRGTYTADHAERALAAAQSALDATRRIDTWVRDSARPRVLRGPAGCGKTHASAAAVAGRVRQGAPAVMVLAKDHNPALGACRMLGETLDLPGWPLGRMLDGLEALSLLDQIRHEEGREDEIGFSRCLLLIDGLEESTDSPQWEGVLADLAVELRGRPRVHLVATARPEYLDQVDLPAGLSVAYIEEDGDVDLPVLFRAYTDHFNVAVDLVPWLGWALQSPLEIRLFAEEFTRRSVSAKEGANANLLTLFRHKLERLEEEARRRAGAITWSAHLGLIPAVLTVLSELTSKSPSLRVPDIEIVGTASALDPEFTAQRIREALSLLHEHGLVDLWIPPAHGLRGQQPEYGLATRHVSDFVLASELAEVTLASIEQKGPVTFPSALRWRNTAAVLYAARLAERGHFLADLSWDELPQDLRWLHAQSLALLPPETASRRRAEIAGWLTESTTLNRGLLRRLTVPISRIPDHPLGPHLLDQALRGLPLAQRDPIWSVPEDLDGTGPWRQCFERILDDFELSGSVDQWNGLPLVAAWACSSVVENRRKRAREMLAVWGASRLGDMVQLLAHMSNVDDPQIVDDVVVAALGAAVGAAVDDPTLKDLAHIVDGLFFTEHASAWTTSIPVRFGARGIVERAALVYPGEFDDELARARPPYAARGDWPPIDTEEASQHSSVGGHVVFGDLDWYVADGCFRVFAVPASSAHSGADEGSQVDHRLLRAVEEGTLNAPPSLADERRKALAMAESRQELVHAKLAEFSDAFQGWHRERTEGSESEILSESELFEWAMKQPEMQRRGTDDVHEGIESAYSEEFSTLLDHAVKVTGLKTLSPNAVRNGMIAHLVKSWGWSAAAFSHHDWDNPPAVVDDAIARRHGPGATHGSRSAVASFREKYVWAAVDRIAGALADRLPVWSSETSEWDRVTNLNRLGNSVPDPMPASADGDGRELAQKGAWAPAGLLTEQFAEEADLANRAELWITQAHLPDPRIFVQGRAERWEKAAVLGFSHFRRGHQCCVDQLVQVRAYAVDPADLSLLRRDGSHTISQLYEGAAWIEEGTYASPSLACWAPWLTWRGQDQGYNSFDADGHIRRVQIQAMVGSITARFEGEWPQEPDVWMPSPRLAAALGVVGMRGGRWLRSYTDGHGEAVAVERNLPPKSFSFDHHYLVTELVRFREFTAGRGLVPAWVIRVYREATPALFMNGHSFDLRPGLKYRSRDVVWLVAGGLYVDDFEVIEITDRLEPFAMVAADLEAVSTHQ